MCRQRRGTRLRWRQRHDRMMAALEANHRSEGALGAGIAQEEMLRRVGSSVKGKGVE